MTKKICKNELAIWAATFDIEPSKAAAELKAGLWLFMAGQNWSETGRRSATSAAIRQSPFDVSWLPGGQATEKVKV